MPLLGREGLRNVGASGQKLDSGSYNQLSKLAGALAAWLSGRVGGEGVHVGRATVLGDLPSGGTQYPACTLLVHDDSGWPWFFITSSATAITGLDSITDGTATTLYAVIKQLAGTSPAAAVGGLADVTFQALPTASAAPAHSLALGAGTVSSNAFTTWTPAAAPGPLLAANGLTVTGTTTLGSLSGVLKATAGVVAGGATAADVGADASGTATAAVAAHVALSDPHTQYARGPASATDSRLAAYDGTTGKLLKDSGKTLADLVQMTGDQTIAGTKNFSTRPQAGGTPLRLEGAVLVLKRTSAQTIANTSTVNVAWQSVNPSNVGYQETLISGGPLNWPGPADANAHRVTVGTGAGGLYAVDLSIGWDDSAGPYNGSRYAAIMVDGGQVRKSWIPASFFCSSRLAWVGYVAAGSYFSVEVYQDSGGNKDVKSDVTYTLLTIHRLQ